MSASGSWNGKTSLHAQPRCFVVRLARSTGSRCARSCRPSPAGGLSSLGNDAIQVRGKTRRNRIPFERQRGLDRSSRRGPLRPALDSARGARGDFFRCARFARMDATKPRRRAAEDQPLAAASCAAGPSNDHAARTSAPTGERGERQRGGSAKERFAGLRPTMRSSTGGTRNSLRAG